MLLQLKFAKHKSLVNQIIYFMCQIFIKLDEPVLQQMSIPARACIHALVPLQCRQLRVNGENGSVPPALRTVLLKPF